MRTAVGLLALTLVACDASVSPAPRIRAVSFAREEVQLDVPGSASTADLLGLQVDAEPGASTAVRWTSSDTMAAPVDDAGVLHVCAPASSVTLTATAKDDTTKHASARAVLSASPVATARITSITDASGLPADVSALRGFVQFGYTVSATWLECSNLARVEFAVVPADGQVAVMFAQTGFPGPRGIDFVGTAGWLTALQPNGRYIVWVRLLIPGRTAPLPVATLPVELRN